ncbi:MAG: hypothetical protein CVU05_10110 [Bacteroidetes bacterium HGW-Bacteroidetes-21]|jgi:hypothetical protein|nr:MAG: hypothetical protein CVU05_10110 [Bacteroidetes bacterium HGW-Bacteroidetes-21]
MKKIYFWILAFIITLAAAYYQRITGPTYPIKGKIQMSNQEIKYKLLRSSDSGKDAMIEIQCPNQEITGELRYRRYKTQDEWTVFKLEYNQQKLTAILPQQPPAGKLEYQIQVSDGAATYPLTEKPVVIRFKGVVPTWVLILHILFIFAAMFLSNLTGLFTLKYTEKIRIYTFITVLILFIGGMILGPIVQKYAFGEYWTGIPFGWDLTDNKTLFALIAWLIAAIANYRKASPRWTIIAAIITLIIFLIPHSMFGSELNYSTGAVTQG